MTPLWPFLTARWISWTVASIGADGHNALGDKAWAGARPLLDQPIVIRLDAGEFEFWVGEPSKRFPCHSSDGGIQHAGIHAVDIHGLQARRGIIGHLGDLRPTLRLMGSITHRRAGRSHTAHGELHTIDHPALRAIRLGSDMRNTIAPLRPRQALGPDLRMFLDVVVYTDESILQFHRMLSVLQKVLSLLPLPREREQNVYCLAYHLTLQAIDTHGIAIEQLLFLILRHASQRAVDELPGFRIGGRRVGIVRLPHDVLDANVMALLNAGRLIPEVDMDLPPEEFAGTRHNTFRPQVPPLPLVVTAFQDVIHPAQAGLRTDPFQSVGNDPARQRR